MICPNCNIMNYDELTNCANCGYPLNANMRPVQPQYNQHYQQFHYQQNPQYNQPQPPPYDPRYNFPNNPISHNANNFQYNINNSHSILYPIIYIGIGILFIMFIGCFISAFRTSTQKSTATKSNTTQSSQTYNVQSEDSTSNIDDSVSNVISPDLQENSASTKEFSYDETIPLDTIYEDSNILIKTTSYDHNSSGIVIGLYIENKTDRNISYVDSYIGINNQTFDGWITGNITAGNKTNTKLEISNDTLSKLVNPNIKCIKLLFFVYDDDDYRNDTKTDTITIKTSLFDEIDDYLPGKHYYTDDAIVVDLNSISGNNYSFSLINLIDDYVSFGISGVTVNGYTTPELEYLTTGLALCNTEYSFNINLTDEFLELNNINEVETIEFNVSYHPLDDYDRLGNSGVITFNLIESNSDNSETNAEIPEHNTDSPEYNLIKDSFEDYSLLIPSDWEKVDDNNVRYYYSPNGSMLLLGINRDCNSHNTIIDDNFKDEWINGLNSDNLYYDIESTKYTVFSGFDALYITGTTEINNQTYYMNQCAILTPEFGIDITLYNNQSVELLSDLFIQIANSINID